MEQNDPLIILRMPTRWKLHRAFGDVMRAQYRAIEEEAAPDRLKRVIERIRREEAVRET